MKVTIEWISTIDRGQGQGHGQGGGLGGGSGTLEEARDLCVTMVAGYEERRGIPLSKAQFTSAPAVTRYCTTGR